MRHLKEVQAHLPSDFHDRILTLNNGPSWRKAIWAYELFNNNVFETLSKEWESPPGLGICPLDQLYQLCDYISQWHALAPKNIVVSFYYHPPSCSILHSAVRIRGGVSTCPGPHSLNNCAFPSTEAVLCAAAAHAQPGRRQDELQPLPDRLLHVLQPAEQLCAQGFGQPHGEPGQSCCTASCWPKALHACCT